MNRSYNMNRIVIVGNGFDLAHGYRTSYKDFIEWYWEQWKNRLLSSSESFLVDGLCSFKLKTRISSFFDAFKFDSELSNIIVTYNSMFTPRVKSMPMAFEFINTLQRAYNCVEVKISPLLLEIQKRIESNWVDIETLYYEILTSKILINEYNRHPSVLNKDLDLLKIKLVEYLIAVTKSVRGIHKGVIQEKLFRSVEKNEIAINSRDSWGKLIDIRSNMRTEGWKKLLEKYYIDDSKFNIAIKNVQYQAQRLIDSKPIVPIIDDQDFLRPDKVVLLNFNYTSIADSYFPSSRYSDFIVNHIHGILDEPNGVIFGYGDEIDDNFEKLKCLNDNDYLQNMKTIKYLETPKYREILNILEEDDFQVYIMGHSCGNSDRTLLNTMFEHRNCVSIKPFYYIDEKGRDNYIDIVQNISRCFTNMQLMRDRVVNKEYCERLVEE